MRLSQELGLKPRQVKFWFQNRRTQMKVKHITSLFFSLFISLSLSLSLSQIFHFHGNPKMSQLLMKALGFSFSFFTHGERDSQQGASSIDNVFTWPSSWAL